MSQHISGIQQIGIGVEDLDQAWRWYRKHFGMDIPMFQDTGEAGLMSRYTGGKPEMRTAVLAANIQGGGAFEVWQYINRKPGAPKHEPQMGDLGINEACLKTQDIHASFQFHRKAGVALSKEPLKNPADVYVYHVRDPYGNIFKMEESKEVFSRSECANGGISSAVIGMSDIDKSIILYRDVLGYSQTAYDVSGVFDDMVPLPGGGGKFRRVLLRHGAPGKGSLGRFIGETSIELVQALDRKPKKIYEDRFWGDLGFMHVCFDVCGTDDLKKASEEAGFPFTVDTGDSFHMGKAIGRFAYAEDADGTLIEMVETFKMPLIKKIGLYLDLTKRDPLKPLPDWMLKTLRFSRVRDGD